MMVGFVPNIYVMGTICDNREKRRNSANRNYQRMIYETAENDYMKGFGDLLDGEIRKIREIDRNVG